MTIEPTGEEMIDNFAAFGRDLLLLENKSLGAKEIPLDILLNTVKAWFASQDVILRRILCTKANQVKPEIVASANMLGIVEGAIRTHYGDRFPVSSAAACVVSYGLAKYCAARPQLEPAQVEKTHDAF